MSGVATAAVAGAYITGEANKDAAETAANATPQFNPLISAALDPTLDRLTDADPLQAFQGPRVAGFTPDQLFALDQTGPLADQLQDLGQLSLDTFRGFVNPAGNPFLEGAIQATRESANRDFSRNQAPALRNTAVAAGGIGGTRQGIAEGLALSDLNRDLINTESQLRAQQFNTDQDRALNAILNSSAIGRALTAGSDLRLQRGGIRQAQEQAEIDAARQLFEEEQRINFDRDLELVRTLLGSPAGTPPIPAQTNPLLAGLGTALTAQQLFGGQTTQGAPNAPIRASNTANPASTNPQFLFGPGG